MKNLNWIAIALLAAVTLPTTVIGGIAVSNGQGWGDWGKWELCPGNSVAIGFSIKAEGVQGSGDDTALNGIALKCSDGSRITSSVGLWGDWSPTYSCPNNGRLMKFMLQVEFIDHGDDTAANNIQFKCTDGKKLNGNAPTNWGTWGEWSDSCNNGIKGIRTRVEGAQGSEGDDTALNNVEFACA